MKFLYACVEPVASSLLLDRIRSQVFGVRQLGNIAESACIIDDELLYCTAAGETHFPLTVSGFHPVTQACRLICTMMEKNQYDYVYLCGMLISKPLFKLACCAKNAKFGVKVIFEETKFPLKPAYYELLQSYKNSRDTAAYRKLRLALLGHSLLKPKLKEAVDTIVVFGGPTMRLWGIPALTVDSGINISSIQCRTKVEQYSDPISILGVVEDARICGYDRMIYGFKTYRKNLQRDKIVFDIVGDEAEVRELRRLTEENQLSDCVRFLGKKTAEEMNGLYQSHSLAVSCLGLYRMDESYYTSVTTRQFCAAGIPFVYAYEELSLDNSTPFALKLANNDSPINIALIGEFVWRCRLNPRLAQEERKFAERHYDWRIIMKRILEFTATGRREV